MGFCSWRKGPVNRREILQNESDFFFDIMSSPRSLVVVFVVLFKVLGPQEIVYLISKLPWKSFLHTFCNETCLEVGKDVSSFKNTPDWLLAKISRALV
jgi:hypothetical protein